MSFYPVREVGKLLTLQGWANPSICVAVSAVHILDDSVFFLAYSLLRRKGAKKVFMTMRYLYLLGLAVATASMINTSIRISRDLLNQNTLLYVSHVT